MTPDLSRTLLRSSWWAILLGLVLEGLQLAGEVLCTLGLGARQMPELKRCQIACSRAEGNTVVR